MVLCLFVRERCAFERISLICINFYTRAGMIQSWSAMGLPGDCFTLVDVDALFSCVSIDLITCIYRSVFTTIC